MIASKVMAKMSQGDDRADYLVMGAGVAGLRAAIELAGHGEVLVVTKESLGESNTYYAQGGIAVAMEGDEDVALHLEDTINAGDGLVYRPAAEALVGEGPARVAELIDWGAKFDREQGPETGGKARLLRTREGAHSLARILHSRGDATGSEISRALVAYARAHGRIRFAEWTQVAGLVVGDGRAIGADLAPANAAAARAGQNADEGTFRRVSARAILVASGGAGQVYSDTTNPAVTTGDGIALAAQAGAELADMEFYQFHPTALSLAGAPRFLISEALRGEGAWLRNDRGERFMERYHALLELAPRDVVARAIARETLTGTSGAAGPERGAGDAIRLVYLDMRHVRTVNPHQRFPGISAVLARYGLDLSRDLIPVRPAAHYLMGGVRTDLEGRTSLKGLYAAGEAACTGVHGANRLASNSLLEGLVFGTRAARAMLADSLPLAPAEAAAQAPTILSAAEETRVEELIARLQSAMWTDAGLLREEERLRDGMAAQAGCEAALTEVASRGGSSRRLAEAQALSRVAGAILQAALARTESRGAHYRNDFPRRDDERFCKHSILTGEGRIVFEAW